MLQEFKRAFYVFLSGLMGVLLFLVMQRSIWLLWVIFFSHSPAMTSLQIVDDSQGYVLLDSITLVLAVVFGGWYGVWLGLHWYDVAYVEKTYKGLITRFVGFVSVKSPKKTKVSMKSSPVQNEYAAFWNIQDVSSIPNLDEIVEEEEKVIKIKPKSVTTKVSKSTVEPEKKTSKKISAPKISSKKTTTRTAIKKQPSSN